MKDEKWWGKQTGKCRLCGGPVPRTSIKGRPPEFHNECRKIFRKKYLFDYQSTDEQRAKKRKYAAKQRKKQRRGK